MKAKQLSIYVLLGACIVFMLDACTHEPFDPREITLIDSTLNSVDTTDTTNTDTTTTDTTSTDTICDTADVSYATTIVSILTDNGCVGCHSSGRVMLNTHANVKHWADNDTLLGAVKHESGFMTMPPSGTPIDSCAIERLEAWINQGTKDN